MRPAGCFVKTARNDSVGRGLMLCAVLCTPVLSLPQTTLPGPYRAMIVWETAAAGEDSLDQIALQSVFSSMGMRPEHVLREELASARPDPGTALIVPHASATLLPDSAARSIIAEIEGGILLVTDGTSPLSELLGIRPGPRVRIAQISDPLRPEVRIVWAGKQVAPCIERYPSEGTKIVYADRQRDRPLGIVLKRGRGQCLYIAPLVDPLTGGGYSRFPTLPTLITDELHCRPLLSRRGVEAYFDPGYRWGRKAEELARMWRSWGITALHVAAWYTRGSPPFKYEDLILALHRNGLLAYAWLEWPYVGKEFWDAHPEWRQKNARLEDAHLDFLYLMDLQNPACMAAALGQLNELLSLDWDGVDVAEFTLTGAGREALEGPAHPEFFTGFTDTGRREFKSRHGFDPLELFDSRSPHYWKTDTSALRAFYRYRTDVNDATERMLFSELRRRDEEAKRAREMILTIVDNSLHPEFDDLLGFNLAKTVAIARQFSLTLDVEDPYTEWNRPPDRYTALAHSYRRLLAGEPFMIDINVVPLEADRAPYFPTAQAAGTEFLQLWHYASGDTGRVCFYCESSVYEKDWQLLPCAMAAGATVRAVGDTYTVNAGSAVILRKFHGHQAVSMDGEPWPAHGDSEIIVPAGRHTVRIEGKGEGPRLLSVTGDLEGAKWRGDSLSVRYRSQGRCALEFDAAPRTIVLDGHPAGFSTYISEVRCTVIAPPGSHTLTITKR
jgi:hypothetical protein